MNLSPTMIAALRCIRTYIAAKDNVHKCQKTPYRWQDTRAVEALIRKNFVSNIGLLV